MGYPAGQPGGDEDRWWRGYAVGAALALGVGLGLRVWFLLHAPKVSGDGLMYSDIARNWFWHGVYGLTRSDGIHATLIRLPGYPLFLAGCFALFGMEHYRAVMMVHVAVDLATCRLIAGTGGRLYGRRAGRVALWLGVVCPFTANYVATVLTETLSLFCVALAFYGVVRWREGGRGVNRWVGAIGGALGYSVLLRPEQGLLAVAVVPAMVWSVWRLPGGWRRQVPVAAVGLMVMGPLAVWGGRNWRVFHVVQPLAPRYANDPGESVPLGFQRWYRTWGVDAVSTEQVYWRYDSDAIEVADLPARAFDSEDQRQRTAALLAEYNGTTSASDAFDARFGELAAERVRASWGRYYVAMPLARLGNMLFRPRTELLVIPLDWWRWRRGSAVAVVFGAINLVYFGLAAWGFVRTRSLGTSVGWAMMGFCLLRCAMLATIDNSEPRYTLELFPVLMVWGAGMFRGGPTLGRNR